MLPHVDSFKMILMQEWKQVETIEKTTKNAGASVKGLCFLRMETGKQSVHYGQY